MMSKQQSNPVIAPLQGRFGYIAENRKPRLPILATTTQRAWWNITRAQLSPETAPLCDLMPECCHNITQSGKQLG
jgi:hypothetical protein